MNTDYFDIRSRIPEPPKWYDEHAVPRYCECAPNKVANIYVDEAALVLIKCQACSTPFEVVFSRGREGGWNVTSMLYEQIEKKGLEYLDPPNIGCCASGPTMTSDSVRVLQYWSRLNGALEWKRDPRFEIEME